MNIIKVVSILKKINNDKEFNNSFVRMTGIFVGIMLINHYLKIFDKYSGFIAVFMAVIVSCVSYSLWIFIIGGLYKLYKRLKA
ncbi:MAG: hypothetical protein K6357_05870 [Elusimicrobiota bacterium]